MIWKMTTEDEHTEKNKKKIQELNKQAKEIDRQNAKNDWFDRRCEQEG